MHVLKSSFWQFYNAWKILRRFWTSYKMVLMFFSFCCRTQWRSTMISCIASRYVCDPEFACPRIPDYPGFTDTPFYSGESGSRHLETASTDRVSIRTSNWETSVTFWARRSNHRGTTTRDINGGPKTQMNWRPSRAPYVSQMCDVNLLACPIVSLPGISVCQSSIASHLIKGFFLFFLLKLYSHNTYNATSPSAVDRRCTKTLRHDVWYNEICTLVIDDGYLLVCVRVCMYACAAYVSI